MHRIKPISSVKGEIYLPADKSISHRALILSALQKKKIEVYPFYPAEDIKATLTCLKKLGVEIKREGRKVWIKGRGLYFPSKGRVKLSACLSGTTMRILSGVLCGQKASFIFTAEGSLKKRPMRRITEPLRLMGADIWGRALENNEYPPLYIQPVKKLFPIKYHLPLPSAQVKSAILLASLYTKGTTQIKEVYPSRDHTERMLKFFSSSLDRKRGIIFFKPNPLEPRDERIFLPGDFSSSIFFIVLALLKENSELIIKNVNLNPTRLGALRVLKRMGAKIVIANRKEYFEPYGDIIVKTSSLSGTIVKENEVPSLIDEIPALCVAASFARGETIIWGVKELKVKETNRVAALMHNLKKAGVKITLHRYFKRGDENFALKIIAPAKISSLQHFRSFSDHRTAMAMFIFSLLTNKENTLDEVNCINKSFPDFIPCLQKISN